VVLTLIALGVGMAAVSVGTWSGRSQEREFIFRFSALFRQARNQAGRSGRAAMVIIDPGARICRLSYESGGLPVPEIIEIRGDGLEELPEGRKAVVFFPDGSSSGGTVEVVRGGTSRAVFRIDPVTGLMERRPAAG